MAKRDRRDNPPERDSGRGRDDINEVERESLTALKGILGKVAGLLKPLGLTPDESTKLVEEMYESVLEVDRKNAGEPDELRRRALLDHVRNANIRRVDGELVVDYPQQ